MEVILGIIVFGLLLCITIYGYMQSEKTARERERGDYSRESKMAMTGGQDAEDRRSGV